MQFPASFLRASTALLLAAAASGCAFVIPPDPNEPRNNTVQGEIRKPQLNPASRDRRSSLAPRELPVASAPGLPPVDATTQPRAEQVMASALDKPQQSGRRVPVENAQFQLASNGYPPINSVPPSPPMNGPGSARERLDATQGQLERDRSIAQTSKEALAKDAAAEPAMLSELPNTDKVVPANDPIKVAPIVPPPPQAIPSEIPPAPDVNPPHSEAVPSKVMVPVFSSNTTTAPVVLAASPLPPSLDFVPPPPKAVMSRIQQPLPVKVGDAYPVQAFTVDLSPEQPKEIQVKPVAQAVLAVNQPNVRPGDFDPLAVADNAPITPLPNVSTRALQTTRYVSNRYIAPSRYSDYRQ